MKRITRKEFIEKSLDIHEKLYDYSKVNYINARTKVIIICPKHGEFQQTPEKHLIGRGCNICGVKKRNDNLRKSQEQFLEDVKNIHGNKYDYSKSNYIGNHLKVEIVCKKHGSFWTTPDNHLVLGRGCPKCVHRISKPELEFLDYLKIPNTKKNRQVFILNKQVDGFDINKNIIYEFLGDYYHGNKSVYDSNVYNSICHKTFGELYEITFDKFKKLKNGGFIVKYIWETDWKKFKSGIDKTPNIIEF